MVRRNLKFHFSSADADVCHFSFINNVSVLRRRVCILQNFWFTAEIRCVVNINMPAARGALLNRYHGDAPGETLLRRMHPLRLPPEIVSSRRHCHSTILRSVRNRLTMENWISVLCFVQSYTLLREIFRASLLIECWAFCNFVFHIFSNCVCSSIYLIHKIISRDISTILAHFLISILLRFQILWNLYSVICYVCTLMWQ